MIAQNCYTKLIGGGKNLSLLYEALRTWGKGCVTSTRKWLPRLLLLATKARPLMYKQYGTFNELDFKYIWLSGMHQLPGGRRRKWWHAQAQLP